MDVADLRREFAEAGQEHVFRFWEELDGAGRECLRGQLEAVDLDELRSLVETLVLSEPSAAEDLSAVEPPTFTALPGHGGDEQGWREARAAGEEALRAGRVAAFTVAGGQGTRLGFDGPKGTFPLTPVRRASLFQVFAEKILSARETYGTELPWWIMTSPANHAATVAFFEENGFFGLGSGDVHFFPQGMLPAVDPDGKLLLESPSSLALSPDGHGGSLRALLRSGATAAMAERGIDTISYFQVDNPLENTMDPAFLGFHLLGGSEMSSKMVAKTDPEEKVGIFVRQGDHLRVLEYSDLPEEWMRLRDPDGSLRFRAANIAIHVLDRAFVERMGAKGGDLPVHRAVKRIGVVDEEGRTVTPEEPNGIKFEMFVFDALPRARNPLLLETSRAENFSPVKNAEGRDSPRTAREDLLRQYTRWLRAAGTGVPLGAEGLPTVNFEISPLRGFDEHAFLARPANHHLPSPAEGTVYDGES